MNNLLIFLAIACSRQESKTLQEVWYERCLSDSVIFDIRIPSYSQGCKDLALKIEETNPTFFHADSKIKEDILNIKSKQKQ